MSRVKITRVGGVRYATESGLQYGVLTAERPAAIPAAVFTALWPGITDPSQLQRGDHVIHVDSGVGVFVGLKKIESEDCFELRFAHDDRLFVPIDRGELLIKLDRDPPKTLAVLNRNGPVAHSARDYWLEAVPNAYEWPTVGSFPSVPETADANAMATFRHACITYLAALHADPKYRQAAAQLFARQNREPHRFLQLWWAYRNGVYVVTSSGFLDSDPEREALLLKHHVLRLERQDKRIQREVEALENLESLSMSDRSPIPDHVRLFVWQRDKGCCVKCGSRERLEFDHIIPISAGGSSTERNLQLLCESCNQSKGATI